MEYLENLRKFLISLANFSYCKTVSILYKSATTHETQLSKSMSVFKYAIFTTSYPGGQYRLIEFANSSNVPVYEINISTYAGALRISNPSYIQDQIVTRSAFGLNIDIMPCAECRSNSEHQIKLTTNRLCRVGKSPHSSTFLNEERRNALYEFNRTMSHNISSVL